MDYTSSYRPIRFKNSSQHVSKLSIAATDFEELQEFTIDVVNTVSEATIPVNANEVLAIIVGETVAGFTGGAVSRFVSARVGGNPQQDNTLQQGTTSGAYFGIRGVVRTAGLILGLNRPLSNLLANVIASSISELAKIAGRSVEMDEEEIGDDEQKAKQSVYELLTFRRSVYFNDEPPPAVEKSKPLITIPEIVEDVAKWVVYDSIVPDVPSVGLFDALECGAIAGAIAHIIYRVLVRNQVDDPFQKLSGFNQLVLAIIRAGLVGASLFASYESFVSFFAKYSTPLVRELLLKKFTDFHLFGN